MGLPNKILERVEAERPRWVLWLTMALALGMGVYFSLYNEPPARFSFAVVPLAALTAWGWRKRRLWAISAGLLTMVMIGFGLAQWHTARQDVQLLAGEVYLTPIMGKVRSIAAVPGGLRLTLEHVTAEKQAAFPIPPTVRVKVRGAKEPILAGSWVRLRAGLFPPSGPVMPGSFDFARYFFFQGIGAVGYALPPVDVIEAPSDGGFQRMANALLDFRQNLAAHVRGEIEGPAGAIAAALMMGDQSAIPESVQEQMRISNLSHILSISGMHMAMIAGLLFFIIRLLLVLVPRTSLNPANKKIAAALALLGCAGYLLISGFPIPAVRAYVMVALLLGAVLADREVTPLLSLSWAALLILIAAPSNLLEPSFQLSFVATLALICWFETTRRQQEEGLGFVRKAAWYVWMVMVTSLVAQAATTPLVAYHFNTVSWFGVAANMAAGPVVSFVVMPAMIAALLLMPLGLDAWALDIMAIGIHFMMWVATEVSQWPYARIFTPGMTGFGLALVLIGGLMLCLMRTRRRWLGAPLVIAGMASALLTTAPDVLMGPDGRQIAVRLGDGELHMAKGRSRSFVGELWANGTGSALLPTAKPGQDFECFTDYCIANVRGKRVAVLLHYRAIADACSKADVLIGYAYISKRSCPDAVRVDRNNLARSGAQWLWIRGGQVARGNAADEQGNRPWSIRPAGALK